MAQEEERTNPEKQDPDEAAAIAATGLREEHRDHALVRLDEKEVKARMISAFDAFLHLDFEVHLVGVKERSAVMYKLLLNEDGVENIALRQVQEIADAHRLDVFFEKGEGLTLYARW